MTTGPKRSTMMSATTHASAPSSGAPIITPSTSQPPKNAKERRDSLRARIEQSKAANIGKDEIDAHFSLMPEHYWESVTEDDLVWGLETIHGFLGLIVAPQAAPTQPFVSWREVPGSSVNRPCENP